MGKLFEEIRYHACIDNCLPCEQIYARRMACAVLVEWCFIRMHAFARTGK